MSTDISAIETLQKWFDREARDHGLIEMCFTVGSDPHTTTEDAARVALAMLNHVPR